ncbi:hypothetical protein FGG08_005526 [Glutinoglossum americanum]|uniref:E3 ubiquitin-protein ligase listerin n=1 Tax=Glutinoglossum americanum TaxID=1670608 RepID=A0A9P8I338_9PEZI|nr:hypothetical protein FGG08_005526 [Glutinoglossum americanum]
MSRRQYKSQASSSRAASSIYGTRFGTFGSPSGLGAITSSLSFISEPPDLSAISDPNVVVAFKNLSKKDSTTKAKALEDLQGYISSLGGNEGGVEDGVLEAWIRLYPRISVDSARKVRQLAHVLQGRIFISSGGRMMKHMPKIAGAWLAGTWDNDRLVSRTARDSIKGVFGTEEKRRYWIKYGRQILEYSRDAILKETVHSLSDERVVSPDDAEAKYARVVATSVCVIRHLLSELGPEEIAKLQESFNEALNDARVISSSLGEISISVLSKALEIDQSGSARDYTEALSALTSAFPTIWTDSFTERRPPSHYLIQFLKKGSQGGPPEFWDNVASIFRAVPPGVLPQDASSASKLLGAYHDGIANSQEPRSNGRSAWMNYFAVGAWLLALMSESDDREVFLEQSLFPIFEVYFRHTGEGVQGSISTQVPEICADGFKTLARLRLSGIQELLESEWRRLAELLIEDVKASIPELSEGFEKSQDTLAYELKRWFSVQGNLLKEPDLPSFDLDVCMETSADILNAAIELLKLQNGESYGAAAAIDAALQYLPQLLFRNVQTREAIFAFLKSDIPSLILSPSSPTLISLLYSYGIYSGQASSTFQEAWTAATKAILSAPESPAKFGAVRTLLQRLPKNLGGLKPHPDLEAYILGAARLALDGEKDGWDIVNDALHASGVIISDGVIDQTLSDIVSALSISDKAEFALDGIDSISRSNKDQLKVLLETKKGSEILSSIVFLTESADEELAHRAESTNASIEVLLSRGADQLANGSLIDIIKNGLLEANPSSISVQSLVNRTQRLLEDSPPELSRQVVDQLLPDISQWETALRPFLEIAPKSSLAITDPLAGCVFLVERAGITDPSFIIEQPRDSNGYSKAIRIASYTARLLKASDIFTLLDQDKRTAIFKGIVITMQLANDNLGLAGANHLWDQYSSDVEEDMVEFISCAHDVILKLLRGGMDGIIFQPSAQDDFWALPALRATSARAFYTARASSLVYSELVELRGFPLNDVPFWISALTEHRKNSDIFSASALISGISQPIAISRESEHLRDRLISDLSGHDIKKDVDKGVMPPSLVRQMVDKDPGLRDLIILNAVLADLDETATPLPQRRVVLFMKHLTTWFDITPSTIITAVSEKPAAVTTEVAKTLTSLLPLIKDIYDSFWVWVLDFLDHVWSRISCPEISQPTWDSALEGDLPVIHATLKLYAALRSIHTANIDLEKEWSGHSWTLAKCLFNLLKIVPSVPDDFHQPLKIVNNLLSRQILALPSDQIMKPDELYPLLCVGSGAVQQTAFEVLRRYIPRAQENISLESALDKSTAKLPEELLSLILRAPTLDELGDSDFERSKSLKLREYLLSWSLVFDHFSNASYKVRSHYIEDLKQGDYLSSLLDFAFDFLDRKGELIDASRFNIGSYDPNAEDLAERDTQWLLLNLYFRVLVLTPTLARSWWFECTRAISRKVEVFTEKFISPSVIEDALRRVSEWVGYQTTIEEKKLQVKVLKQEVMAGYEVDEQTMQVAIRFPPAYPLQQAAVEGINRVGVDEKKWNAWLISARGVITFSDGSIVDGLQNWRGNVERALLGQTECAICYSIVSSGKELPTKECSTCKNLFHGSKYSLQIAQYEAQRFFDG